MFSDLERRLPTSYRKRRDLMKEMRKILAPAFRQLAREVNPFKVNPSKYFGTVVPKQKENETFTERFDRHATERHISALIKIFGIHPNVADDPNRYPLAPQSEAFKPTSPYVVRFSQNKWRRWNAYYGQYRTVKVAQEHSYSLGGADPLDIRSGWNVHYDYYYKHDKKVYGYTSLGRPSMSTGMETNVFPIYSSRSIASLVESSPEVAELVRDAFLKASKKVWGGKQ